MREKDKNEPDVIDSLFFALKMNSVFRNNVDKDKPTRDRIYRITRKAWVRHWTRVQKAIDAGNSVLRIPDTCINNNRFDSRLVP